MEIIIPLVCKLIKLLTVVVHLTVFAINSHPLVGIDPVMVDGELYFILPDGDRYGTAHCESHLKNHVYSVIIEKTAKKQTFLIQSALIKTIIKWLSPNHFRNDKPFLAQVDWTV